jgi:predicted nuclease of predicted toxin-antitoxin system
VKRGGGRTPFNVHLPLGVTEYLKLDENMPEQLAVALRQLGHNVHTVPDENLARHSDATIWAAAQSEQRFLITQDLDFPMTGAFNPAPMQVFSL